MHFHASLFLASTVQLAAAETITILGGDTYFSPSSVNASVGDVLEFHFLPHNHSVVMGDFDNACQPASSGGFYSGFLPASSGENASAQVFRVTINDTNPFVYYCSQNASSHNHCKSGMVGFVNQLNESAMTTYLDAAAAGSSNVSPDGGVFGGVLAANSNSSANATTANGTATTSGASGTGTTITGTNTGLPHDNSGPAVGVAGGWLLGGGLMALLAV